MHRVAVRTTRPHELVVDGVAAPFEVAGSDGNWLVVVGEKAADVCLVEQEAVYGGSSSTPEPDALVWKGGVGVTKLSRSYQHLFEAPPKSVTLKQGQSEHRWVLHAFSCSSHAEDTAEP